MAVSIHTRHYWRVKPPDRAGQAPAHCFNPHPPLLAGETQPVALQPVPRAVSIHTRHYWRVKRLGAVDWPQPHGFQSTPAITGG